MRVVVCVKQVPDSASVRIDEKTGAMVREGVPAIVNPFDRYAIEEALRLRERHGGTVAALTMGPPQAAEALRDAVAMGVDEGYHLTGRAFAGADTLATSYALARGVTKVGEWHLVICGKQAVDGDTAQVGPELAEHLGVPFVGFVRKVRESHPDRLVLERMTEEGADVVECPLPAVISVVKEINEPRLPSLKGKMRAKSFQAVAWGPAEVGADEARIGFAGSPTKVAKVFHPEARTGGEMLAGAPAEVAAALAARIAALRVC